MGKQDLETEYAKKFDAKHYIEIILKERNAMSIFIENTLHAIFDESEFSNATMPPWYRYTSSLNKSGSQHYVTFLYKSFFIWKLDLWCRTRRSLEV